MSNERKLTSVSFRWRRDLASGGEVIEEFRPLAESVEWRVGQDFLRASGAKSFVSDSSPVPFVVNNDGDLSCRAAELLFASLSAESAHPGQIIILELGIGVGLFARFFLDRFHWLCQIHEQSFYDRVCYILGDYSPKMLMDASRNGVLSSHRDRYRLRVINALDPQSELADDLDGGASSVRAVFLNYLLDCLPAAVLEIGDGTVRQLCVRTHFRPSNGESGDQVTAAKVSELLKSDALENRRELRALADSFVAEYEFQDSQWTNIPEPHCFEKQRAHRSVVVHSFGAIQCLERLIPLLDPCGFILMNDYGSAESECKDDWFEHQRYSGATFVGVNFDQIKRCFQRDALRLVEPPEGSEHIYSRMLGGPNLSNESIGTFTKLFSKSAIEEPRTQKAKATAAMSHQRYETALSIYRRMLEDQPYDWMSLGAVSQLLAFGLCDPAAGLSAIREAIAVNPSCSSLLWDIAGECMLELGQPHEARKAFLRAIEISPDDVRASFGLAAVYMAIKDWSRALQTIAKAMGSSRDSKWTQQLLMKQAEVLTQLNQYQRDANRRLANRIRQAGILGTSNRLTNVDNQETSRSLGSETDSIRPNIESQS